MWFLCSCRRRRSSFLDMESDEFVWACVWFFEVFLGGESFWISHKISSAQFAARQCSISPQFSADTQNKPPVSRSILSTCRSVDLPVSRPRLIDSWVKASGTWVTPHDYCLHMTAVCQTCRPHHIMTINRRAPKILRYCTTPSRVWQRLFLQLLCIFWSV